MRFTHLAACAATLSLIAAPTALAKKQKDVDSSRLDRKVTVEGIVQHQEALQNIADMNAGTRYTRTPGYAASAAYVLERMKRAGLNAHYETFDMPIWQENAAPVLRLTAPSAKTYKPGSAADDNSPSVDFIALEHSPTKAVANVEVVPTTNIKIPSTGESTSGCDPADFPAATRGAVSLIQRGTCGFTQKLANAVAAGAVGVILFNEGNTDGRKSALFRSADPYYPIPGVLSSYAVGEELYNLAKAGQHPKVDLGTSGFDKETLYPNVVAETKGGDRNHMVLAGAHLDSVEAGPGVNDDGSGTAFQLELAEQIAKGAPPRNKIRFLWFGGEEDGLVGSQYYAAHMSNAEVARTDMMLDTDMIASSNFARLVYDGDGSTFGSDVSGPPGSGKIEQVLRGYWDSQGRSSEPIPFDGRSDYVGFVNRGIPAGGVFAGAEAPKTAEQVKMYGGVEGEQLDPCYHEACDNITTLLWQPPAETMNVYEANPTPANYSIAARQAASLRGNALRSLKQFKGTLVHAVWYFAQNREPLASAAKAKKARSKRAHRLHAKGHTRARTR